MISRLRYSQGVSLVEVLLGLLIIILASIGTLSYFSFALGGVGKQSNRRAALERARQRLEQLMAAKASAIQPPDGNLYWLTCTGNPCAWTRSAAPVTQTVPIDDLPTPQPIETTIQWVDDPSAGTVTRDVLELGVKAWFIPNSTIDDNVNRVYLKTLRTP